MLIVAVHSKWCVTVLMLMISHGDSAGCSCLATARYVASGGTLCYYGLCYLNNGFILSKNQNTVKFLRFVSAYDANCATVQLV